ncbi:MAG TPA: hypothetical protein VF722_14030, partial [Gemmatimonadaceae bacterium]
PSIRGSRPELDDSIDRLLGWMLAKEPAQRFPDAARLLAALEDPATVPPLPRPALHRVRQAIHALGTMLERVVHPSSR